MAVNPLNYATSYQQALDQVWPYVLYYGALYATPNNGRYRWQGANAIQIPTIATTGRVDADRDTIQFASRNYDNSWELYPLKNHRKWSTLIHPMDIDETNFTTTIQNITQVFNEEQKFPEMDAYTVSKIFTEWEGHGGEPDTTVIDEENVLEVFNELMLEMTEKRVPATGRILYCTPRVKSFIENAKVIYRSQDIKDGRRTLMFDLEAIDLVRIVPVPPELMMTIYNFTAGWQVGTGAQQINMMLIHPLSVITPVKYAFAQLSPPSAMSEGKWVYFEEAYEDVFVLKNKVTGIQMNVAA